MTPKAKQRTKDTNRLAENGTEQMEAPSAKLEDAILSVLVHYEGRYEETLWDWYLALRLSEPELLHPRQLIAVFDRLSEAGIVQFITGNVVYTGGDDTFFLGKPFTTLLRTEGIVQPSTLKI